MNKYKSGDKFILEIEGAYDGFSRPMYMVKGLEGLCSENMLDNLAKVEMGNGENAGKFKLSELDPGEVFKIGEYDFIVLEQKEDSTCVISKGFMAAGIVFDDNTRDYNSSNLKRRIESDVQPVIEGAVGTDNIIEHEVKLTSVDMQQEFTPCKCKVRPITFDEARRYNDLLVNKELDDWWWTCTPWSTKERGWEYSIAVVSPSGCIGGSNYGNFIGVRPFCILKSNIFVSKVEE